MTHDSIGVGEDGPTHQPIEHLLSFRAMPNVLVLRPCGGNETAGAYKAAIEHRTGPSLLVFSRQTMGNHAGCSRDGVSKGGYIVSDCEGTPSHILIGTGSELDLCVGAAAKLAEEGVKVRWGRLGPREHVSTHSGALAPAHTRSRPQVRVVSMPCCELFDQQSAEYKESVLPKAVTKRVSVEAGCTIGWHKYVGSDGACMGIDRFGASAPAPIIYEKFGLTVDNVAATAKGTHFQRLECLRGSKLG